MRAGQGPELHPVGGGALGGEVHALGGRLDVGREGVDPVAGGGDVVDLALGPGGVGGGVVEVDEVPTDHLETGGVGGRQELVEFGLVVEPALRRPEPEVEMGEAGRLGLRDDLGRVAPFSHRQLVEPHPLPDGDDPLAGDGGRGRRDVVRTSRATPAPVTRCETGRVATWCGRAR